MATEHETQAPQPGLTYGRRKYVSLFLIVAAWAAYLAAVRHNTVVRAVEGAIIVWMLVRAYQFWTVPMPARYAARVARLRDRREWSFGHERGHKLALGLLAVLVLVFAVGIIVATLSPHS